MLRKRGFTLIELLVVIAIISILAAIVVPNVMKYLRKARATKAFSEIKNIELAMTKMLSDADRKSVMQLFTTDSVEAVAATARTNGFPVSPTDNYTANAATLKAFKDAQDMYSIVFYELLRRGRDADVTPFVFDADIRAKLGTQYMDLPKDPWGKKYQFWPGPWDKSVVPVIPFRAWRLNKRSTANIGETGYVPYIYNLQAYQDAQSDLPGNPPPDDKTSTNGIAGLNAYGYPASVEDTVYVWSDGENLISEHLAGPGKPDDEHKGGGDDVNSWDKESGWSHFYN